MNLVISLPNTPSQIPENLTCSQYFSEAEVSLILAQEILSKITVPDVIAGSFKTPVNWWLAAHILFPKAKKFIYQGNGNWLSIIDNNIIDGDQPAIDGADNAPLEIVTQEQADAKLTAIVHSPEKKHASKQINATDLAWETYTLFVFNNPNAENLYQKYLRQAENQSAENPRLVLLVKKNAKEGRRAAVLKKNLDQKIERGENMEEIHDWIELISNSEPPNVVKTLRVGLQKHKDFQKRKNTLGTQNHNFRITLPDTLIERGLHPQSLRALSPSKKWEIYVDETGKDFTEQAQDLNESDIELGRIVALVMPEDHGLPSLNNKTHAIDLTYSNIQQLLNTLLKSNVGVLGATLKADIQSYSWIAAITKLVRWSLMMLPINGHTQVVFKIENRGDYKDSATLKALEETLIDDLRQLAPERFKELQLSLELVSKDASYNGYVDVIANCWGSRDETKRRLLARTKWRGHCLLQSTDLAEIDRLYQDADSDMDTDTWFSICTHLAKEPGHSLFYDLLTQLGERVQRSPTLWRRYLSETQHRIALKAFDAGSLGRALTWLNQFQPDNESLPGLLQLQLKSAQLASENHLGHCDVSRVDQVMILAQKLKDESAPDACEAALRIAISATNSFDFTSVVPFIEDWISQPIAVPGRLNYGKLLSTLGQLCAFRGEYEQASRYFDDALEHFDRLSDLVQAASNHQQTSSYKAIVQLDQNAQKVDENIWKILNKATGKMGPASIKKLARSGSPLRFEHYLLLRWLASNPQEKQLRQDYLSCSDDWKVGEGHPWMLINAYRSWLLADANRVNEATSYLQKAVDDCSEGESSAIFHWMGHCLYALGQSFELTLDQPLSALPTSPFPSDQLIQLQDARTTKDRMEALNKLLPFNFH